MKMLSETEILAREQRRQAMQVSLDAERSSAQRNRLGQFATPNALAVEIARCIARDRLEETQCIRFADPSIGTGSFYSAALQVFGTHRMERAVGVELDHRFVLAARELWGNAGLEVIEGDFTRIVADASRGESPNLVLANPPYVRHHHLHRTDKERLQALASELCGVQVHGLAGLYVYFVLLATAWMQEGGVAAWLIPSEFMDVNYGSSLKQYLTDRVTLDRIHRFDPNEVQFGDALVSSAVVFFRKQPPSPEHRVAFTFGGTLERPAATERIAAEKLRTVRKWTIYPTHAVNDRRISDDVSGPTLSDFFRIQRGIATGGNKFFILRREEAETRRLPSCCLRPILPSPRHLKDTEIEGDATGYPLIDEPLCLIDCDLPEHIVETRYPALWKYLKTADSLGVRDGYLVGKRTPWYKQEHREPAPFLCTYMGRGAENRQPFRFIWNRSQAIATNLFLMLYPQKALAAMLAEHPQRHAEVFALLGAITGHELRGEGRVYGGGLNKIEPNELGRVSAAAFVARWPELSAACRREKMPMLFD